MGGIVIKYYWYVTPIPSYSSLYVLAQSSRVSGLVAYLLQCSRVLHLMYLSSSSAVQA